MLKILAIFFIVLGIILRTSYKVSIKKENLTNKQRDDLEKSKHTGSTFIFAGISAFMLSYMFTLFK
ncbi:hypothetical protein [Faecalimicrobium sp. JNUCC 81]